MLLRWVELRDFRNHAHTKLKPIPEGLLVAVGANGEGKTNLLEGMHFLYALQSPRASASEPLVRHGASSGSCAESSRRATARSWSRRRSRPRARTRCR